MMLSATSVQRCNGKPKRGQRKGTSPVPELASLLRLQYNKSTAAPLSPGLCKWKLPGGKLSLCAWGRVVWGQKGPLPHSLRALRNRCWKNVWQNCALENYECWGKKKILKRKWIQAFPDFVAAEVCGRIPEELQGLVDGSLRLRSAGRATVLPQVQLLPIIDLLCEMGSDN